MKKTMTSINPPFSNLILDGKKKIEWRTKPLPLGWNELYETKKKGGCGKVIGQFEVVENIKVDLFELACNDEKGLIEKGCVDWGFLNDYATLKRSYLYANVIDRVERYDKPKELGEFYVAKPIPTEKQTDKDDCIHCKYHKWIGSMKEFVEKGISMREKCTLNKPEPICEYTPPLKRPPQSWFYVESLGE